MSTLGVVCRLNSLNVGDSAMYDNLVAHPPTGWTAEPIVDSIGAAEACRAAGYAGATTEGDADLARFDTFVVGGGDFDPSIFADRYQSARRTQSVLALGISLSAARLGSEAYWRLLHRARGVYARDRFSADLVRIGCHREAEATCDLAWDLGDPAPTPDLDRPVLLTLRAPISLPPEESWPAAVALRAAEILDRLDVPWSVLPCNSDDETWSVKTGLTAEHVTPLCPGDAAHFRERFRRSRLVVTVGRLHPAIFALSMGIPTVAVATRSVQVGPKIRGLFDLVGLNHLCAEAESASAALLEGMIRYGLDRAEDVRNSVASSGVAAKCAVHWGALASFLA